MIRRLQPAVLFLILFIAFASVWAGRLISRSSANSGAEPAPDASALFNSKCAKCHGRDGRGKTTRGRLTHARDLTNAEWQNDVSDERLFNSISHGKGKMPSFKKLSDAEIDSLVSYVRQLRK